MRASPLSPLWALRCSNIESEHRGLYARVSRPRMIGPSQCQRLSTSSEKTNDSGEDSSAENDIQVLMGQMGNRNDRQGPLQAESPAPNLSARSDLVEYAKSLRTRRHVQNVAPRFIAARSTKRWTLRPTKPPARRSLRRRSREPVVFGS